MRSHYISFRFLRAALFAIALSSSGCAKLIEIDAPKTQVVSDNVFSDNSTAAAVLTGLYAQMSNGGLFTGFESISLRVGLQADELSLASGLSNVSLGELYVNNLRARGDFHPWFELYRYLNVVNTAIEGLDKSQTLSADVKQQLLGESKFIRAFLDFYLVNLYDSVPLVTSSDYRVNNILPRSAPVLVYQQIIDDLKDAVSGLSEHYLAADVRTGSTERVRPSRWAAETLLARVYLYTKDYANAVVHASNVIARSDVFDTTKLSQVFLNVSKEAIWQLAPLNIDNNTLDGNMFILTTAPNSGNPVYCSPDLLNAFEPGDLRRKEWIDSIIADNGITYYFPYKYKIPYGGPPTEYTTLLRLAEVYLIRAEANAHLNELSAANADLNVVRQRAGLPLASWSDEEELVKAILHERQVELFTEWGHRWLDLKRTGTMDAVMTAACAKKGGTWKNSASLYPVPNIELERNSRLTQNKGY